MIRNIIASILVAFPVLAYAQGGWLEMRPGTFFNQPTGQQKVYLSSQLDGFGEMQHTIVSYEGFYCYPGEHKNVGYIGDYYVNGRLLAFKLNCVGGYDIYIPQSEAGKQYLADQMENDDYIRVNMGGNRQYEYRTENYDVIKREIIRTDERPVM